MEAERTTLETKRALVIASLVCLILWVPAHRLLVLRFDLNPWKFGGFAMYAEPVPKIGIGFFTELDGALVPLRIAARPEDQALFVSFFETRKHAGMLVPPDALADQIFESDPAVDALTIVITRRRLDPVSARLQVGRHDYRYRRGE